MFGNATIVANITLTFLFVWVTSESYKYIEDKHPTGHLNRNLVKKTHIYHFQHNSHNTNVLCSFHNSKYNVNFDIPVTKILNIGSSSFKT